MVSRTIYCFWTGNNPLTDTRERSLNQLAEVSGMNVILVTKATLNLYIIPEHPLHEAYHYLSETHKADYLRTYFMHFYGGGYSDIKHTTGSWVDAYNDLVENKDAWICGYKEIGEDGVAYKPYKNYWKEFIGVCCFICKPKTPLTHVWYRTMLSVLDKKLSAIKKRPSAFPQDCAESGSGSGYPVEWSELMGQIFHRIQFDFSGHIRQTLPAPNLSWGYR